MKVNKKDAGKVDDRAVFEHDFQNEYANKARALCNEIKAAGFPNADVYKGEDNGDFFVLLIDADGSNYRVIRDYAKNVHVTLFPWKQYTAVSNDAQWSARKEVAGNNVKVLNHKKLRALIDAEKAFNAKMQEKQEKAEAVFENFIAEVERAAKEKGVTAQFYKASYGFREGKIESGYLTRNGVEFHFEIMRDGYVSKKIEIRGVYDSNAQKFLQLSDNNYTEPKE